MFFYKYSLGSDNTGYTLGFAMHFWFFLMSMACIQSSCCS